MVFAVASPLILAASFELDRPRRTRAERAIVPKPDLLSEDVDARRRSDATWYG